MSLYKVPIIGDGKTPESAFRPDVPPGVPWTAHRIESGEPWCVIEVLDAKADLSRSPVTKIALAVGQDKGDVIAAAVAEIEREERELRAASERLKAEAEQHEIRMHALNGQADEKWEQADARIELLDLLSCEEE